MEETAVTIARVEDLAKSNEHRIDDLEKKQADMDSLVSSVAVFAKEQEHIQKDVQEIKSDVKALTLKPAKKWDGVVDKILYAVVGAFVAWLLSNAGM